MIICFNHSLKFSLKEVHFWLTLNIVVKVENAGGGIFAKINEEKVTYDSASTELFGRVGTMRVLEGNRIPNQLLLKFVSNRFENVNVLHVLGSIENGDFEFFVLGK